MNNNGIHPSDRNVLWESKEHLKRRIEKVIKKYENYECVIFVFHQIAIKSIIDIEDVKPAQIIEYII